MHLYTGADGGLVWAQDDRHGALHRDRKGGPASTVEKCLQEVHMKRKTGKQKMEATPPAERDVADRVRGEDVDGMRERDAHKREKVPVISDNEAEIWNEQGNVLLFALITMATLEGAAAAVRDKNWGDCTVTPKYMQEFYQGVTKQTKADFTKRCLEALQARQRADINWEDDEMQATRNDPKGGTSFHNRYGGAPYINGGTFSSRGGLPALPPMPMGGGQCDCTGSCSPQFGPEHDWAPTL
jgi:hypothetical protein